LNLHPRKDESYLSFGSIIQRHARCFILLYLIIDSVDITLRVTNNKQVGSISPYLFAAVTEQKLVRQNPRQASPHWRFLRALLARKLVTQIVVLSCRLLAP
jgi:hypothetical protein